MDYCLITQNITKKYRKFTALNGVNMSVPKGAIYGFVGKNGAGKTTLIRIITGLQEPSEGEYTLLGIKNNDTKNLLRARRRTGAIVETPAVYGNMTAYENMRHQSILSGNPSFDQLPELLELVGLNALDTKKVKNFSLGMRQRLSIALTLVNNPDFLILDEPINGLDPQGIVEIRELILKLNRERNITFLISSHILGELSKLATHYGFIEQGKIIKEMSAKELEEQCRKKTYIKVANKNSLAIVLDKTNYDYKLLSPTECEIFGDIVLNDLLALFAENKLTLLKINETEEDLETYFINLVGGKLNE